jgi:hypothetical protein
VSTEGVQQPLIPTQPSLGEERLLAWMAKYEPVLDMRTDAEMTRPCAGRCGRVVALDIALCVLCRNASRHPAFGR